MLERSNTTNHHFDFVRRLEANRRITRFLEATLPEAVVMLIRKDSNSTITQLKTLTRHGTDQNPQWTWLKVDQFYPECPGWESLNDKLWKSWK